MSFLQPLFFWASTLIVPLAAIYFLKVRPRRDNTTALFLWQRIYQQKQASSLLNRLRDLLSLLLLILAFMLLTLAMAKPELVSDDGKDLLLIIDNSASMAAKAEGDSRTRLQEACKQAKKIVTGMGAGKRAAIATIADQIDYKSYLTDNSKQLVRAIEAIEQTEIPFNIEAIKKASGSLGSQKNSRMILISDAAAYTVDSIIEKDDSSLNESMDIDGNSASDPNVSKELFTGQKQKKRSRQLPGGIELVKISSPAENIGIVSCDMQEVITENGKMSFYCRPANSGKQTVETNLLLYLLEENDSVEQLRRLENGKYDQIPGTLLKVMPLTVNPGLNDPVFFDLADNYPGRYIALLEHSDAAPADNIAYLTIPKPDPIQIGVLSKDRFFFEHCVQAFSQSTGLIELSHLSTETEKSKNEIYLAEGNIKPGMVDGSKNGSSGKLAAIIFNPQGESDCWSLTGNKLNGDEIVPKIINKDHPALRYYDPTVIPFYGAKELTLPVDVQVLLETDTGIALMWRVNRPDKDIIVVNIDPSQGQFYYSPFFPVMVYRMALSLAGREKINVATCSTNDPIPEYIRSSPEPVSIIGPVSGEIKSKRAENLPPLVNAGFYTLEQGSKTVDIACSLLNTKETLLNDSILKTDADPIRKGHSPSYWLTLLALLIVAAECVLYHKRKVG